MFTNFFGALTVAIPLVSAAACPAPCFNKCAMAVKPTDPRWQDLAVADCAVYVQDELTGLLPEYVLGKCKSETAYMSACACIGITSTVKPTDSATVPGSLTAVTQTPTTTFASEYIIVTSSTASAGTPSSKGTTSSVFTTTSSSVSTTGSVATPSSSVTNSSGFKTTISSVITTSSVTTTSSTIVTTSSVETASSNVFTTSSVVTTSSSAETTPSITTTTSVQAITSVATPEPTSPSQTIATTSSASLISASLETSSEVTTTTSAAPPGETQFKKLQAIFADGTLIDLKLTRPAGSNYNAYVHWNDATIDTPTLFEIDPSTGRLFVTFSDGFVSWATTRLPGASISGEALTFREASYIELLSNSYYYIKCTRDALGFLECESEGGRTLRFAQLSATIKHLFLIRKSDSLNGYIPLKVRAMNPPPAVPPATSTV